ncbi:tetratricopeptide repeat protein [Altererythrobacter luteolus]|uniref:Tetratricopeptide repeat protein n=1 Tax=Pontixanthobacter luteolus TaxID=295089 RepID=A0A6I4UW94_9SPHN|nr:tetratricopeptide repeat protein [Pontixanthobacter luteolus]MXP45813.1 tetratricopeptide repeat protein [Pontixanthobacter luteolus]
MAEPTDSGQKAGGISRIGLVALVVGAIIVAAAVGYRALGEGEADQDAIIADGGPASIEQLKAAAEKDPLNAGAWQELGFAYYETGQFSEAVRAYRQAVEGDDKNAVLWSSLGEARLMASETNPMPSAAITAFEKAIALDPTDARARYFLAVRKDLSGDHQGAINDWLALLKDTPPGAPWEQNLRQTIEQVGKINNIATDTQLAAADSARPKAPQLTAGNAIPGPSREQIAAAGAMAPGEQREMAEGMVGSLAAKLRANPANPDGWVMLMRSRMTLGQPDQAAQALKDAIAANPGEAERLTREAAALGVPN